MVNPACIFYVLLARAAALESTKYLILSSPRLSKVVYMKIGGSNFTKPLIEDGLKSPQGIAVENQKKQLFVSDPDSKKIWLFPLLFSDSSPSLYAGKQMVAAHNVEARWVACDGVGNIFFTDERENLVQTVSAENILKGDPTAKTLYNGISIASVSSPGGIAADNFHLYWSNKAAGTMVGSVVKGYENPPKTNIAASVKPLSKNVAKVYGVCLCGNNAFYTDVESYVYGVKKTGGAIITMTDKLLQPRGCTWDGDGTVYVADKMNSAVYSFAGNMQSLVPTEMTRVVDYEDAFSVGVVSDDAAEETGAAFLPWGAATRSSTFLSMMALLLVIGSFA